jgi:uncharacterized membrane protein
MTKFRAFIKTTTLGGITVVLPAILLLVVFRWLFRRITDLIQPLTDMVVAQSRLHEIFGDVVVLGIIFTGCFLLGLVVRTKAGRFFQDHLEEHILNVAPGYRIIKETVMQLLGRKKSPFSSVALVKMYDSDALMTGFITDEHSSDWKTVFIPTGPNPTTGYIVHLPSDRVYPVNVRAEVALRSVIACGAGSQQLLQGAPICAPDHRTNP